MRTTTSAFFAIETDYEFVSKELTDRAARFLIDFNHVSGMLAEDIQLIATELQNTAIEIALQQGLYDTGTLVKGIRAHVLHNVIELRSTAYRIPHAGGFKGYDKKGNETYYPRRKVRYEYKHQKDGSRKRVPNVIQSTNSDVWNSKYDREGEYLDSSIWYVQPQESETQGTTGGVSSLRQGHKNAWNINHNIQYYGGHVEFGHRDRGGGFVEARPHLRPALRIVSAASIGQLENTMKAMLLGVEASFDGYKTPGLRFGKELGMANIKGAIGIHSKGAESPNTFFGDYYNKQRFQSIYSVAYDRKHAKSSLWNNVLKNDMNWGHRRRKVDYTKLGGKNTHGYSRDDAMRYTQGVSRRPWGKGRRRADDNKEWYLYEDAKGNSKWGQRAITKKPNIKAPTKQVYTKTFLKMSPYRQRWFSKISGNRMRSGRRAFIRASRNKGEQKLKAQQRLSRTKELARRHRDRTFRRNFNTNFNYQKSHIDLKKEQRANIKREINDLKASKKVLDDFVPEPFDIKNTNGLSKEEYAKAFQQHQIDYAKGQQEFTTYLSNYHQELNKLKKDLEKIK